jgi:low temperature requirement protein LtrA
VWVYTTWITNWLNPELTPVRVLLFVLMFAGLVLSTSIPQAFGARGVWFASPYAAMQVGHTLFWLLSVPRERAAVRWNAIRILIWLGVSAVFWVWGGMAQNVDRLLLLWAVALVIEYAGPMARFWIPEIRGVRGRGLVCRGRPHGGALRRFHHHCPRWESLSLRSKTKE